MINIYQALLYYSGHSFIRRYFPLDIFSRMKQRKNFHKVSTWVHRIKNEIKFHWYEVSEIRLNFERREDKNVKFVYGHYL